jgi:hypothetical protein
MMTSWACITRKEAADPLIGDCAQQFRGSKTGRARLSYVRLLVRFRAA